MSNWPLHQFHGGIQPMEYKTLSNQGPILAPPLPKRLRVPLLQHIGQPAIPCVDVGDYVYKGQLIARNTAPLGAHVHAPSSGQVAAIAMTAYPHHSGEPFAAIEIHTDGLEQWQSEPQPRDFTSLANAEIFELIQQAGIAGLGGAGFPTANKLNGKTQEGIDSLIINGTECEPYITADDLLMRERAEQIMHGVDILVQLTRPKQVLIAIEDNKPEAITAMRAALGVRAYQVLSIPTLYPSGGEKQLVQILTGQEVPAGKLPIDLKIICQNVGTAAAVYNAVCLGHPLISRIITLTGEALARPMNVDCLIGTPIAELLEFAGVNHKQLDRVIIGGPMMGFEQHDLTAPVIKTTNCLIASTRQEIPPAPPALACIRCGACEDVCPSNLLPQQLFFFATGEQHDQLQDYNLFDCIECGCCSYVCPSTIPLVQYYRAAKAEIREIQQKQIKAEHAKQRYEQRQQRLKLEQQRKAAERKARNERLARVKAAQEKTAKQQSDTTTEAADDQKKRLKIVLSMANVALRKAEKQLAQHDTPALQEQVTQLQQAALKAQQEYDAAQAQQTVTGEKEAVQSVANPAEQAQKRAKIQVAKCKAALKKAEKAEADNDELLRLQQELSAAEQQLASLATPASQN